MHECRTAASIDLCDSMDGLPSSSAAATALIED